MTKRIGTWTHRSHPTGPEGWTQVDLVVSDDGLGRVDLSRCRPATESSTEGSAQDVGPTPDPALVRAIEQAVAFAAGEARCAGHSVEILRIRTLPESPVAAAVVRAFWDAVGFVASESQLRALDGLAD